MKVSQAQITALECEYKAAQELTSAEFSNADIIYAKWRAAKEQLDLLALQYGDALKQCDSAFAKECDLEEQLDAAYLARDWADTSI